MDFTYISNEGPTLFLYRNGSKLQFVSAASCTLFLNAVEGGRASMVDAIVKNNVFVDVVVPVNEEVATTIVDEYFGQRSAFWMIGTADDFQAVEHGAPTLEGAFPALSAYIKAVLAFAPLEKTVESTSADPTHVEKTAKMFSDLHIIFEDATKRSEWLSQHAAVRQKRNFKDPLPITGGGKPMGAPMWSISTFNATGKQKLTFDGKLPISMVDTYVIVQQPEPSFTMGLETLSWYSSVAWFAYGGNGASMVWKTITGRSFGVSIWVPMVYFGVGSDPYYLVWRDDFEHWFQPPGGPSAPYTFPEGSGYTVQVLPTCGGKELFVQMHVQLDKGSSVDGEAKA